MQIWILLPSSKYGKIWIQGTMLLTYGMDQDPDPAPGSAIFVLDLQDTDQKQLFYKFFCFVNVHLHHLSNKKSSRNFKTLGIKVFLTIFAWWSNTGFVTSMTLKNDVNVPLKSNKQKGKQTVEKNYYFLLSSWRSLTKKQNPEKDPYPEGKERKVRLVWVRHP